MNIDEQINYMNSLMLYFKVHGQNDEKVKCEEIQKTLMEVKEWEITREYVSSAISQRSSIKKPGNQGG